MSGAKRRIFCHVPPLFITLHVQLIVLVSVFVVYAVHFDQFLLLASRCPRAQPFVKVGV